MRWGDGLDSLIALLVQVRRVWRESIESAFHRAASEREDAWP